MINNELKQLQNEGENQYLARLASIMAGIREKQANNEMSKEEYKTMQDINTILYESEKLKGFVYSYLKQHYPSYFSSQNREDLVHEAFAELFKYFHLYNGDYEITTFSKLHIIHGAQRYISHLGDKSAYENEVYTKIHREKSRLLSMGYSEDEITISMLMESLKLTQAQIEEALKKEEYAKRETYNPDLEIVSSHLTPEQEVIEKYNKEYCHGLLKDLAPYEKYALISVTGAEGDKMTYEELGRDATFLRIMNVAGLENNIKNGVVPSEKCKSIYKQAILKVRASSQASEKMTGIRQSASNYSGEYLTFAKQDALENANKFFELLNDETPISSN